MKSDHRSKFSNFSNQKERSLKNMGVSKTQTTDLENADLENADLEKKKKRRTKGLKFITLASKSCFCGCTMSVFYRSKTQTLQRKTYKTQAWHKHFEK